MTPDPPTLPFGLEEVLQSTPSPLEQSIVSIIGKALQVDNCDSDQAGAQQAANAIDQLCPPTAIKDDTRNDTTYAARSSVVGDFLWELWGIVRAMGQTIPHDADHPGQATVVDILVALRKVQRGTICKWGSDVRLWHGMPYFCDYMDDYSGGPCDSEISQESLQVWLNQSAFNARCLAAGLPVSEAPAVQALCLALEGDMHLFGTRDERCTLLVAATWMIHCAPILLQKAGLNIFLYEDDSDNSDTDNADDADDTAADAADASADGDLQAVSPGVLFREHRPGARAGLSSARWAFWRKQFKALLQPGKAVSEDVRVAVALALERMRQAERQYVEQDAEWQRRRDSKLNAEAPAKET